MDAIAETAVETLVRACSDQKRRVREAAVDALRSAPRSTVVESVLLVALKDRDADIRQTAIAVIKKNYALHDEWSVPHLVGALKDGNSENRSWAAYALRDILRDIRPGVKEAGVLALIRVLDDRDPKVRVAAVKALGAVGPDAKQATPGLIQSLNDRSGDGYDTVQESAVRTLGAIGPDAKQAVPMLRSRQKIIWTNLSNKCSVHVQITCREPA